MVKACAKCGTALSLLQRLATGLCAECRAEADRTRAEAARAEAELRARQEREEQARRYAAALKGEAASADLDQLAADGHLVVGGRLILCPVCGHDRFHQQRLILNTRAATFLNLDWAISGVDARVCRRCAYVMWFALG